MVKLVHIMSFTVSMAIRIYCLTDIHLFGLFPLEGQYSGGRGLLPSAMMAVEDINRRQDILPGYKLHMKWNNSKVLFQCDQGIGIKALSDNLNGADNILMVIGGACSGVSQATAQASHLWNLVQITYGSVSPSLSDKKKYPKFFRVIAPESQINTVRVKLFKHFGWNTISIISQNMELFSSSTEDLIQQLDGENMTVHTQQQFFSDPTLEVQALKVDGRVISYLSQESTISTVDFNLGIPAMLQHHDARIIVGNFYPRLGRRVICQAFRVGLYGKKVVWLLPGWFDPQWYIGYNDTANCTTQDILKVIDNSFSLDNVYYNPRDDVTISNMTPSQFRSQYTDYINRTANNTLISGHERAPVAYDVIWAAAIALNKTNTYLQNMNDSRRIENFTYTDRDLGQLIFQQVRKLSFPGLTGRIQFDERGDPRSRVSIRVFRDARNVIIGDSDVTGQDMRWTTSSTDFSVFPDGRVPVDSVRVEERVITLPRPVYIAMCCLAGAAILLAIAFLVFNVVCRNERIIKMSSPNLNNVILSGCVITYTEVFLTDLDGSSSQCQLFKAKIFVLTVGFSMTFGALFAKTWRVYAIFTSKFTITNKVYKDWSLFLLVGVLILVNSGILLAWILTDSITVTHHILASQTVTEADVTTQPVVYLCSSPNSKYYLGSILGVLGTLLFFGVFLAWETRKVSVEVMNDSRYIGICIYNTVVLGVMGVVVSLSLGQEVLVHYSLESAITILTTTVTQTLIFVPKITDHWSHRRRRQKGTPRPVVKTVVL